MIIPCYELLPSVNTQKRSKIAGDERARPAAGWRAYVATACGEKHVQAGALSEDSVSTVSFGADGYGKAISVADGHGSPQYFRAGQGSAFATEAAAFCAKGLLERIAATPDLEVGNTEGRRLAEQILDHWRSSVRTDITEHPFKNEERDKVPTDQREGFDSRPEIAYGTTLISAVAWARGLLVIQIGDGDVVSVDVNGNWRRLIEAVGDDEAYTDSLCGRMAIEKFRVHVERFEEYTPPWLMIRTDGWEKSFENENKKAEYDLQFVTWLQRMNAAEIESRVTEKLPEMSAKGYSHDDISLGILLNDEGVSGGT